ncbi:MAG: hypothetical protein AAF447_18430 [Myxococcota bacterium]
MTPANFRVAELCGPDEERCGERTLAAPSRRQAAYLYALDLEVEGRDQRLGGLGLLLDVGGLRFRVTRGDAPIIVNVVESDDRESLQDRVDVVLERARRLRAESDDPRALAMRAQLLEEAADALVKSSRKFLDNLGAMRREG